MPNPTKTAKLKLGVSLTLDKSWGQRHGDLMVETGCPLRSYDGDQQLVLHKAEERTVNGLWSLIGKLIDIFQPDECANYFIPCGYEPE